MDKIKIEHINIKGLKDINDFIEMYQERGGKTEFKTVYTHEKLYDKILIVSTLLDAISDISLGSLSKDRGTCGELAEIAKKFLPYDEMQFLDVLLLKEDWKESKPTEIKSLTHEFV